SKKGRFKSVSSEDEGVTRVTAAIAEDEPPVGKVDARSGQWVEITMKKVQRLLSMTDGEERKHVLEYTHVDLHYVEDQKKNLLSNFNDEHLDGIGGNTRDLDSIWEETEKNSKSTLHEFQY
ncbi:hypothetical protein Tco_0186986, partial [Tanacetum coccineum]